VPKVERSGGEEKRWRSAKWTGCSYNGAFPVKRGKKGTESRGKVKDRSGPKKEQPGGNRGGSSQGRGDRTFFGGKRKKQKWSRG